MSSSPSGASSPKQAPDPEELLSSLTIDAIDKELAERSLVEFVRQAWHVIEPGVTYQHNWHIEAIAQHLEAVTAGTIRRLLVNVPFRTSKSTLVSVLWPAWVWLRQASHQWLCISHASTLATRDNLKMRRLIESPWFRSRWGDRFELTTDQNQKTRFENDRRGYRLAMGLTSGVMGEGGDSVIIDDPHDRDQAHSDLERESALTSYDEKIVTRLNDPARGPIVIIMQRLHEDDLSGHVLEKGGFEHLMIPMEFEPERKCTTSLGWSDPRTTEGELMWPERFPRETVDELKRSLGSYGAAGQLQQRPAPLEGGLFKRDWWQLYDEDPREIAATCDRLIQSWDMSFKGKKTSSFVVGQVWGQRGADLFLLDQVRGQWEMPETCTAVVRLHIKWPAAHKKLVEDKANGPAVMQTLKGKVPGLVAAPKDTSKEAAWSAASPYVEAGNVYLPAGAPWLDGYIGEHAALPASRWNDQADATAQAILDLTKPLPGIY